ncbi:adenylate/guanylate cyclase domain-containing protein|nr:adenylate/guanylate cyclase domain-containing protein [Rhizobium altiplani]
MEVDEERTHAALNTCNSAIAGLVSKHSGRIFAIAGDSFLAEFASPVEAMRAAIEFQEDVSGRSFDLPEGLQMRFRIGINLGDVIVDGGNLFGDGVNVAVRLEALAEPGGICLSSAVYEQVADSDVKPAANPIKDRPPFRFEVGHRSDQRPASFRH